MSGPLPAMAAPVSHPLSWLYRGVVSARNKYWESSRRVATLGVPTISVGNITVGGTGKSPLVRWIANGLCDHGYSPAILLRGYRGGPDGSDEALEHLDACPGASVAADPDRVRGLRTLAQANTACDVAILDDGFQHRRVARGLDLVVIDGGAGTFNQSLLPAGWLREPVSSLRRADAVIVTHADEAPIHLDRMIEESHGRRPIAHTNHTWDSIDLHSGEQTRSEPPRWLDGRRVVTRLGVGRPEAVVSMIESCGATVIRSIPAADHEAFTPRSMEALRTAASDADVVVMTAKDWVNARELIDWAHWSTPIAVPQLTLSWVDGEAALWSMILAAAKQ